MEMDITTFLLASCHHFQGLVEAAREEGRHKEGAEQNQGEGGRKMSVRFSDLIEEESDRFDFINHFCLQSSC